MISHFKHPLVHIHIPSGCGSTNLVQTSMQIFNQLRTRRFGKVVMWQSIFSWQKTFLNEKSTYKLNLNVCMLTKFWKFLIRIVKLILWLKQVLGGFLNEIWVKKRTIRTHWCMRRGLWMKKCVKSEFNLDMLNIGRGSNGELLMGIL